VNNKIFFIIFFSENSTAQLSTKSPILNISKKNSFSGIQTTKMLSSITVPGKNKKKM